MIVERLKSNRYKVFCFSAIAKSRKVSVTKFGSVTQEVFEYRCY